jgi:ribosomal protein L11 methyltransferase
MRYNVATIDCTGLEEWQTDVLSQALADLGFDSFEQDGETLRAYIPSDQLSAISNQQSAVSGLEEVIAENGARLVSFEACADENWNAVWESEHEVEELPMGVRIVPHCAFGAGHHETTAMMINRLIGLADERVSGTPNPLTTNPLTVLDMGTGTGVLAIMAAKLGAEKVVAVDIDENSVKNARENAEANGVTIDVRLGSNVPEGTYNLIMANIHRNILLAQMADYARTLIIGGELWLSGFYDADCPTLIAAAAAQGLQHISTRENGEWRMLCLRKG